MPTKEKEQLLAKLQEHLRGATAVVVSHYAGLTVEEANELRRRLRQAGVSHIVAKNTLARLAVKEVGLEGLLKFLHGPTAISATKGDIVAPARILSAFAKEHEKLKILGGVLEGREATVQDILAISSLPSREELLAKLLATLQSPISGLARVLQGPLSGFIRALKAIADKKAATA